MTKAQRHKVERASQEFNARVADDANGARCKKIKWVGNSMTDDRRQMTEKKSSFVTLGTGFIFVEIWGKIFS